MQPTELSNGTTKAVKRTEERLTISASVLVFTNQIIRYTIGSTFSEGNEILVQTKKY